MARVHGRGARCDGTLSRRRLFCPCMAMGRSPPWCVVLCNCFDSWMRMHRASVPSEFVKYLQCTCVHRMHASFTCRAAPPCFANLTPFLIHFSHAGAGPVGL